MFKRRRQISDKELDSISGQVIRAASLNEDEADSLARVSYRQVRERINARAGSEAILTKWGVALSEARRAIPAMALLASGAAGLLLFVGPRAQPANLIQPSSPPTLLPVQDRVATPVSACSISARSECAVSTDDVLALMMEQSELEKVR